MKEFGPYIVPLIVVLLVGRRLLRNKPRKVKTSRIFWFPGFIVAATALTLWSAPLATPWVLWIFIDVVALAAGLAVGFFTAHHQKFTLDYDSGTIMSKATPIGTILIVALFAARFGLRFIMPGVAGSPFGASSYIPDSPIPSAPHGGPASIMGWTDAGLIFSAAMIFARAATTWFRAQPLIHAHREHVEAKTGGGLSA